MILVPGRVVSVAEGAIEFVFIDNRWEDTENLRLGFLYLCPWHILRNMHENQWF